jgi:hypothetical protein
MQYDKVGSATANCWLKLSLAFRKPDPQTRNSTIFFTDVRCREHAISLAMGGCLDSSLRNWAFLCASAVTVE